MTEPHCSASAQVRHQRKTPSRHTLAVLRYRPPVLRRIPLHVLALALALGLRWPALAAATEPPRPLTDQGVTSPGARVQLRTTAGQEVEGVLAETDGDFVVVRLDSGAVVAVEKRLIAAIVVVPPNPGGDERVPGDPIRPPPVAFGDLSLAFGQAFVYTTLPVPMVGAAVGVTIGQRGARVGAGLRLATRLNAFSYDDHEAPLELWETRSSLESRAGFHLWTTTEARSSFHLRTDFIGGVFGDSDFIAGFFGGCVSFGLTVGPPGSAVRFYAAPGELCFVLPGTVAFSSTVGIVFGRPPIMPTAPK